VILARQIFVRLEPLTFFLNGTTDLISVILHKLNSSFTTDLFSNILYHLHLLRENDEFFEIKTGTFQQITLFQLCLY
jgi:hypothetical protein